jgi:hypothetical protein
MFNSIDFKHEWTKSTEYFGKKKYMDWGSVAEIGQIWSQIRTIHF